MASTNRVLDLLDTPVAIPGGERPLPVDQVRGEIRFEAVQFGYGPAVDSTATWILTGLLLSAMLMPYVDRDWIAALPTGIDVPIAALIGLPLYVCATGSTPLAAMLLVQGLSPGAVLALLLTGPATNVTTFGVLARLHGTRTALVFVVSMWLGAVLLGYLANWLITVPEMSAFGEHAHESPFAWVWLWGVALVFGWSLLRQGVRPFLERLFESPANMGHGEDHGHSHEGHSHDHSEHGHSHEGHAHAHSHPAQPEHEQHEVAATPPEEPSKGGCCGH